MHRPFGFHSSAAVGAAALGTAFVLVVPGLAQAAPTSAARRPHITSATWASLDKAYTFLDQTMDVYGTGSTLRLPQSFTGGYLGSLGFVSSFTYDDDVTIMALLQRGDSDDIARAETLGNTLLYAQAHDPIGDGRLRASYQPDPFITSDGAPYIGSAATYTGNMAWAGMAFSHLYADTGDSAYLNGALAIANWIQTNAYDGTHGTPGYTGGRDANNVAITYKATEHNIDVGAFFAMLAKITGDSVWSTRSATAFAFVHSMWNASTGSFWTGTETDGVTVNTSPVPEDVQTWSYLATGEAAYASSIDWVESNLAATDNGFTGVSFSNADTSKVWFEGTAHLLDALYTRGTPADLAEAAKLLATLQSAQVSAPNADGEGIVAASSDGLQSGYGDTYYASLHTGATSWYILAAEQADPFVLGPGENHYTRR